MAQTLNVDRRETTGRKRNKRLRIAGKIPAILYGHGEECVNLTVPKDALSLVVRQGAHLVELQGAVTDTALIREVQWNTYGTEILHIDFNRVSKDERVKVSVPVELRGDAPGVKAGGVIQHVTHALEIEVPVINLVDRFDLKITSLELEGVIHAKDVPLPEGAVLLTDGDAVVVQCVLPREELPEAGAPTGDGSEPEVIARKKEEGEGEEE